MRNVDHHASAVIVRGGESEIFFFNGYDFGYWAKEWRGCLNPFGGSFENGDISPHSILERELIEELSDPFNNIKNFAYRESNSLKNAILKNIMPFQDFLIIDPVIEKNKDKSKEDRTAISSIYLSIIDLKLLKSADIALKSGKKLSSEGDGGNIVSINDLLNGKKYLSWTNPFIMSYYTGEKIPYLMKGEVYPIGVPRKNLSDYLKDFSYTQGMNDFSNKL